MNKMLVIFCFIWGEYYKHLNSCTLPSKDRYYVCIMTGGNSFYFEKQQYADGDPVWLLYGMAGQAIRAIGSHLDCINEQMLICGDV